MDKGPIPPHSAEAEQALLGSIMLQPLETLDLCRQHGLLATIPSKKDGPARVHQFYVPAHETIYLALLDMAEKGDLIDLVTVTNALRTRGVLDSVGGPAALTMLCTMVPTAANAEYYIDIIRRKYLRREVIRQGTDLVRRAYDDATDENLILDEAQAQVTALSEASFKEEPVRLIAEDVDETLAYAETIHRNRGRDAIHGLSTGFHDLDRMTGGFVGGQLIVFAGRPAMGKTIIGLNIAEHVALTATVKRPDGQFARDADGKVKTGVPVLIFSLEMSRQQLMKRFFVAKAKQDEKFTEKFFRTGYFSEHDIKVIIPRTAGELRPAPIYLDATPALRVPDFKARSRRYKVQGDIGLIVIDYVQLMKSPSKRAQDNRQLEMSEITSAIKEMAKELNIPIIALAQLNRDTERRTLGEPRLMDLRESGSIENDADFVGLLYRKHYYSHDEADEGMAKIIIAKHRDGPPGEVDLVFVDKQMRFENALLSSGEARPQWSNKPEERQEYE
jgi:replicative DNA helicase